MRYPCGFLALGVIDMGKVPFSINKTIMLEAGERVVLDETVYTATQLRSLHATGPCLIVRSTAANWIVAESPVSHVVTQCVLERGCQLKVTIECNPELFMLNQ